MNPPLNELSVEVLLILARNCFMNFVSVNNVGEDPLFQLGMQQLNAAIVKVREENIG